MSGFCQPGASQMRIDSQVSVCKNGCTYSRPKVEGRKAYKE